MKERPSDPKLTVPLLRQMHRSMLRIRLAEEQIALCVEAREITGPCHLYIGQEAIATGVCLALRSDDYVWGGHRSHGHYLAKGGSLDAMIAEIFGKITGCSRGRGGSMHLVAPEVGILGTVPLVAATIPCAVGSALASRLRSEDRVSVAFFGDGATDEGHFYESLNLAALYRLPVLFVCENNFYSSHMQLLEHRLSDNLTEVGASAGMESIQLDGNDVVAVYATAVRLVKQLRESPGPVFLECRTYRWRGHVGPAWDMDVGVARKHELPEWVPKDPILRIEARLRDEGEADAAIDATRTLVQDEIEAAVRAARRAECPSVDELTKHVFATRRA